MHSLPVLAIVCIFLTFFRNQPVKQRHPPHDVLDEDHALHQRAPDLLKERTGCYDGGETAVPLGVFGVFRGAC